MLLILGAFLLLEGDTHSPLPNRTPRPARLATLQVKPLLLASTGGAAITGAWMLTSNDNRVAGLSALAVLPDGRLQALSDSGALVTFARPGRSDSAIALVEELPGGPGYPTFKKYRDSEAMILDRDGRGRLVAFEYLHSLWYYPATGGARKVPLRLPSEDWRRNTGIEAMVIDPADGRLLLLHEGGRALFRVDHSTSPTPLRLAEATGGVADAIRLPDGRMVAAIREIGITGLTNRLAWLERTETGYRLRNFATLRLGPLDNVEGLAAQRGPDGRTILWAITDNDGWRRTLLLRLELDTTKAPA